MNFSQFAIIHKFPSSLYFPILTKHHQEVQGDIESLEKTSSLLLRLESNLLAKTGDIVFFLLGHFAI